MPVLSRTYISLCFLFLLTLNFAFVVCEKIPWINATFLLEGMSKFVLCSPIRYFIPFLLTQQGTITIIVRHFCLFICRIKHGFVRIVHFVKSVVSSAKNTRKLLFRFNDITTSRQLQACWVFETCHWTFIPCALGNASHSLSLPLRLNAYIDENRT